MDNPEELSSEEISVIRLALPVYDTRSHEVYGLPRWLIVKANLDDAAISLLNRGFLRREPGSEALYTLTEKAQAIRRLIGDRQCPIKIN